MMSDHVHKRSISIAGHRTSVSLENAFWEALSELARRNNQSLARLIEDIDSTRSGQNLSSALRLYVLTKARQGKLPLNEEDPDP